MSSISPVSSDPWLRKLWAITEYHRQQGRIPDLNEALDFYEMHCRTTGPRDRRRESEISKSIKAHQEWFDPHKAGGSQYGFRVGRYLSLASRVPDYDLWYKSGPLKKVIYEDVDVFIGICTEIAFSSSVDIRSPRAARDRIIRYFRRLKAEGEHPASCNNSKYQRLLELTEQYGLLEVYAPHLSPVRRRGQKIAGGYGRLIGPGPQHPLHAEFLVRCDQLNLTGDADRREAM